MAIVFHYDIEGWRPTWAQMLDICERYCRDEESFEELEWIRSHPADWLMCARYLRVQTENVIAKDRKRIKDIQVFDEAGRTRGEYISAKRAMEKLNGKRLHWMEKLEGQIQEAKYILGYEKISDDMAAQLVDRLMLLRTAVISDLFDGGDVRKMVDGLLRTYAPDFDPEKYRPRYEGEL